MPIERDSRPADGKSKATPQTPKKLRIDFHIPDLIELRVPSPNENILGLLMSLMPSLTYRFTRLFWVTICFKNILESSQTFLSANLEDYIRLSQCLWKAIGIT